MVLILVLTILRELSTLEDELERLREDVWLVLTLALRLFSDRSMLDEEFERLSDDV